MGDRLDRTVSIAILIAAIALTGSALYGLVHRPPSVSRRSAVPEYVPFWHDALGFGYTLTGDSTSRVTIIELADLECPACRDFQPTLDSVVARHGRDVRLVFVSHPLTMHHFAMPSARGGDCAARLGQMRQWISTVYSSQDSLGLKSWGALARSAGIDDTAYIARCAASSDVVDRVTAGLDFGNRIKLVGTPTILINGWKLPAGGKPLRDIERLLKKLERGQSLSDTTVGL